VSQGRQPHAVLLAGPAGTGKRAAAAWIVRRKLGLPATGELPTFPAGRPVHADLHWLEQAEDRTAILIDQVRALVAELALTSYSGRGKVAVIDPANAMNNNAANSLLKTLEEPRGDTLLLLIADRPGRLPATIFSRCQRIDFAIPPEADSLTWLNRFRPGTHWAEALRETGGAPLAALDAADRLETTAALRRDFAAIGSGSASPIDVAEAWAKLETPFVLEWLARQVQAVARALMAGDRPGPLGAASDSVLQRMDRRNLFCYLDLINRLRAQPGGSFNAQLALEGLLIDWATGLRGVRTDLPGTGLRASGA
jgi:DNA polymerase III subunit delta'